jgi:hypothetical protein
MRRWVIFAAGALAAVASAEVSANPLESTAIRSTVTIDYKVANGLLTGSVKSVNSNCKKSRTVTVRTNTGETVARATTRSDGSFQTALSFDGLARREINWDGPGPSLSGQVAQKTFIETDKKKKKRKRRKCAHASSRPEPVSENLNCRSNTLQDPSRPDEDTLGFQCPLDISKVWEVARAPILNFSNPGLGVAPPGEQGVRSIPGAQLSADWVEYNASPELAPNWVFINRLRGLPNGTDLLLVAITPEDRAQVMPLTTK